MKKVFSIRIIFLSTWCILLVGLSPRVYAEGWWQVYFTDPEKNLHGGEYSPPEQGFIRLIDSATRTIDGAFFEIGSKKVASAFVRAQKRGVRVRLVSDDSNKKKDGARIVQKADIPVVFDNKRGLMHNKFAIVDGRYLWTGSYNITDNCAYHNNNNAILIDSPELSLIFEDEFEEMFVDKIFENKKERKPLPVLHNPYYVKIADTNINAYFSPDNDVEDIIVKRIKKAKSSIYFLAFSFTSDPIGEAMIAQAKKGVMVEGLFEKHGSDSKDSEYNKFRAEGIPVKTDRNPKNMHHKVIIIDEEIVITGSYNFSRNASKRNDENIIIIENSEIAKKYLAEFRHIN
ncbi:MAG TPA: phospholipase D-like domain-containing protein [Spirochaetota bacterium]